MAFFYAQSISVSMNKPQHELVDQAIRGRQTIKVFAENDNDESLDPQTLNELLEIAGWAPFHRKANANHLLGELNSPVPWRFYVLPKQQCINVRQILLDRNDSGKLPQMLAAATTVINVTWLPNPSNIPNSTGQLFEGNIGNMEHIAAAASAIQNLLVAATARGINTYWSSGGALRKPEMFDILEIPGAEILLGSVFFFPTDVETFDHVPGKLRSDRGQPESWSRQISL